MASITLLRRIRSPVNALLLKYETECSVDCLADNVDSTIQVFHLANLLKLSAELIFKTVWQYQLLKASIFPNSLWGEPGEPHPGRSSFSVLSREKQGQATHRALYSDGLDLESRETVLRLGNFIDRRKFNNPGARLRGRLYPFDPTNTTGYAPQKGLAAPRPNSLVYLENLPELTILGLPVPVFWALIITLFIVLAAGIGGGVGGGLSAQQKSRSGTDASRGEDGNSSGNEGGSGSGSTSSSAAPSPTTSSTADSLVPTDGGCPGIHNLSYTPYSADGKPIPLETNRDPQEFREQCWTNWVNTASTHDILRTYTPTLENCITVCAEYNKAYAANLKNNNGVGGGPCVAVTIVKAHAGFCYLKNGTGTNDTMGAPNMYSSAVLVTS
ncbi:hypothetical protein NUW58_g2767 [Xylaria curta]|uniref:Uncharacterized protein n=1 Tax=Xylaria curta TaxID=42375 RepID=A0ACC1PGD1_9PEZI|nr:hypothetical protein NUW58_g2767 [Xylaria curta]